MIPQDVIRRIKESIDIVAVIGSRVRLKRSGSNYKGLCPFHREKTPSFFVSPSKNIFHCFGCGESGDVIAFLMKYENKEFMEVVEELAVTAGIDLDPYKKATSTGPSLQRLHALLDDSTGYYRRALQHNRKALEYLERRRISRTTAGEFLIGYAPGDGDALVKFLKRRGYSDEEITASGMGRRGRRGLYDYFRDRITIPIRSDNGRIAGYGGRIAGDGQGPKYLNLPDTPLFSKGRILFNLDRAAPRGEEVPFLLLVEGYMDVITIVQGGIRAVVAPLGTGLTSFQINKLATKTGRLYLCYDNDEAGIRATMRAIEQLAEAPLEVKVVRLAPYKDADEAVRAEGAAAFERRLADAVWAERFYAERVVRESATEKARFTRLKSHFERLSTPAAKQRLLSACAELTSIDEAVLRKDFLSGARNANPHRRRSPLPSSPAAGPRSEWKVEEKLVLLLLANPDLVPRVVPPLRGISVADPFVRRVLAILEESLSEDEGGWAQVRDLHDMEELIIEKTDGHEREAMRRRLSALLVRDAPEPTNPLEEALHCISRLKLAHLEERKRKLLKEVASTDSRERKRELLKELSVLTSEISRTRKALAGGSGAEGKA